MKFQNRWFQEEATDAAIKSIIRGKHPLIALPTATGKSVVVCLIIDKFLSMLPNKSILVLCDDSNILLQNKKRLESFFEGWRIGLYSADLLQKDIEKITVAGIQSIYNKPELFENIGLIIIDEAHKINKQCKGMYRKFLGNFDASYCGLTATPFRTGQGMLHEPPDNLFDELAYDLTEFNKYNRLLDEGFLIPHIPIPTDITMNVEGIRTTLGDFDEKELSHRFAREELTDKITDQIIKYGKKKYKKWLIFCIDKKHCEITANLLNEKGIPTGIVYSGYKESKQVAIRKFRAGEYRALVNVNMLTTGVDITDIDLISHLRPSKSPIYHVQSNGRGSRPHYVGDHDLETIKGRLAAIAESGVTHCLVLDFAGNTERLGPINDIKVKEKKKSGLGQPITKRCGNCNTINHPSARNCIACGEEFIFKEKIMATASPLGIIRKTGEKLEGWLEVKGVDYSIAEKKGSPSSLRVQYNCGFVNYSQRIFINHKGYPRQKALAWVANRYVGEDDHPRNLNDLIKNTDKLKIPSHILVNLDGEFPEIKEFRYDHGIVLPKKKAFMPQKTKNVEWDTFDDDIPF